MRGGAGGGGRGERLRALGLCGGRVKVADSRTGTGTGSLVPQTAGSGLFLAGGL